MKGILLAAVAILIAAFCPADGFCSDPASGSSVTFSYVSSDDLKGKVAQALTAKDYDRAVKLLEPAVSDNPFDEELKKLLCFAYTGRGWARLGRDDVEGGYADLSKVSVLEAEKQAGTYLGLGFAKFRMREYDDALSNLFEAVYLDPKDARGHSLIGEIRYRQGDLTEAVKEWEVASGLDPEDQGVKSQLAKAKSELNVEQGFTKRETYYFNIKYEGEERRELGDEVLDVLHKAYSDVGGDLGYFPKQQVTVILYTRKQFNDVTDAPSWSGGVYDGTIRIPIGGRDIDRQALAAVLYHEYTHAALHLMAGSKLPTWLDEGIAQYEERWVREPREDLDQALFTPLSALNGSFMKIGDPAKVRQAYAESLSAVRFYVDRFGQYNLGKLVRLLGEGSDISDSFRDTTGVSFEDFGSLWSSNLGG